MKESHAFIARNALRGLIAFAALGGLQVAHAINKGQMSQFRYTPNGNSVSIKPNQNGSTGALAGIGDLRGSTGTPIGNTGWYHGGNAPGGSTSGQTMHMVHTGDVFFAGTKYPFQAGYQVPKGAVVEALGMLCKNPVICLGLSLTAPAIAEWLAKGDVGINPNESDYPDKPFVIDKRTGGKEYTIPVTNPPRWFPTPSAACSFAASTLGHTVHKVEPMCELWRNGQYQTASWYDVREGPVGMERLPASMDDIAPYMDPPDVPADVVRDLLDRGADIKVPSAPTVTGPTSLPGRTETTRNPDGSTTTTTTTNNFRTDGNRITNTSTVTTTQTCTGDGACSPTTTTTTEDPKEPEQSDCEKNPEATRCKDIDLDTPEGEIPKADKNVTYQIEDAWGGGSCPANIHGTINGQSMMLYDWGQTCGYVATYLRPMIYLCCALASLFIVMPGKADT